MHVVSGPAWEYRVAQWLQDRADDACWRHPPGWLSNLLCLGGGTHTRARRSEEACQSPFDLAFTLMLEHILVPLDGSEIAERAG
jgi:hypothetical protein